MEQLQLALPIEGLADYRKTLPKIAAQEFETIEAYRATRHTVVSYLVGYYNVSFAAAATYWNTARRLA